jgi:hypothetical protein
MAALRLSTIQEEPEVAFEDVTMEEAINNTELPWVRELERNNVPIRRLLTGRAWVSRFEDSSQLEIVIHQIFLFMDQERENWTRSKRRYLRREQVFARNLFNVIVTVRRNLIRNLGVKPPIDRDIFLRLMVCYDFEPFYVYWSVPGSQRKGNEASARTREILRRKRPFSPQAPRLFSTRSSRRLPTTNGTPGTG